MENTTDRVTTADLPQPFTRQHMELLKLFGHFTTDEDISNIRKMILRYLGDKLSRTFDEELEAQGLHPDDLIGQHMRTPYETPKE